MEYGDWDKPFLLKQPEKKKRQSIWNYGFQYTEHQAMKDRNPERWKQMWKVLKLPRFTASREAGGPSTEVESGGLPELKRWGGARREGGSWYSWDRVSGKRATHREASGGLQSQHACDEASQVQGKNHLEGLEEKSAPFTLGQVDACSIHRTAETRNSQSTQ